MMPCGTSHAQYRYPTKNTFNRRYHCVVHSTRRTTSTDVHAGGRRRWSGWRDRLGRYCQPANQRTRHYWTGCINSWMHDELLQWQEIAERLPQPRYPFPRQFTSRCMVDVQAASSKHYLSGIAGASRQLHRECARCMRRNQTRRENCM